MKFKFTLLALMCIPIFCFCQRPLVEGWNENKIKWTTIYTVPCMIRIPSGYFLAGNATKRYPIIFSFHGTGEAGTDTVKVLNAGLCKNLSNNGSTTYTHEGSSKTVGTDSPTANDKNGNSREAIVVAPQHSSYSADPAWFPYMFADITSRLRVDSSMVYLYGYSAGNWPASGIIANNSDTTYNRFVTAINSSSGATQDLTWSGVSKIGKRNIPFFVVTGDAAGSDISYREQAIREVDSIDNPSPTPLPVHVVKTGEGHCCFDTRAANSTTYSALGNKNLIQWFFQYANPYATIWTPGNANPTANAGTDQSITLPTSSVSLSGSGNDVDGTIAGYQWSKISGPSTYTITSPTNASTTVTGLVQGVYVFRLTVTDDDSGTGSDDIQITVNPSNANPTANAGTDQGITLPTSSVSLSGSGNDTDGTITSYQWTKFSGPSTYTITSPTSASTTVTGLVQGVYVFRLTVTDDDGATGSDDIQVTVNAAAGDANTINVNVYGGTNPYSNSAWNDWNVSSSLTSSALNYADGNSSSVTATLTASQGIGDNGSSYGGSMCPPEVLRYTSFATSNRTLTISNLDGSSTYDIEFYCSRSTSGNSTVITIGGVPQTVATDNNKTTAVSITGISPDGSNQIVVSLARLTGATYQYLNGFKMLRHPGGSRSINPITLVQRETIQPIGIYPSITNDALTIRFADNYTGSVKMVFYDQQGRVIRSILARKSAFLFQQQVTVNTLRTGLYYIAIITDKNKVVSKFIKQ